MGEKKVEVILRSASRAAATLPQTNKEEVKKELQQFIVLALKKLLSCANETSVKVIEGEQTTIFEIDLLKKEDFGRLVGRKGKNIHSLRTLTAAMAACNGFRAIIQIKDEHLYF